MSISKQRCSQLEIARWAKSTLRGIEAYSTVPQMCRLDNHMENILTDDSPIKCIHTERQALNPLAMVLDIWRALHHKRRDVLVIAQDRKTLLSVTDSVLDVASYICPATPFERYSEGDTVTAKQRTLTGEGVRLVGMVMDNHVRGATAMQIYVKDAHLLEKESWDTVLEVVASNPGCGLWVETSRPPSELTWILDYDRVREFYVPQPKASTQES